MTPRPSSTPFLTVPVYSSSSFPPLNERSVPSPSAKPSLQGPDQEMATLGLGLAARRRQPVLGSATKPLSAAAGSDTRTSSGRASQDERIVAASPCNNFCTLTRVAIRQRP